MLPEVIWNTKKTTTKKNLRLIRLNVAWNMYKISYISISVYIKLHGTTKCDGGQFSQLS